MRGATLCSGIGAPECAAPDIDWIWSSDIEAFPNAVRAIRYPDSINLGDMTAEDFVGRAAAVGLPDVLVAGTPCQAFSIAGLRQSLLDDRGNLTLLFIRICDAVDDLRRAAGLSPLWIVWENVPGVLSVSDNAFGSLLAGLGGHDAPIPPAGGRRWANAGVVAGPRRGVAWRTLDAQHFGVAQRRKRVFLLARGGAGNFDGADALLPIIDSLQWHPAPRRQAGKIAPTIPARSTGGGGLGTDFDCDGGLINEVAVMSSGQGNAGIFTDGSAPSLTCLHEAPIVTAFHPTQDPISSADISHALGTGSAGGQASVAVAFSIQERAVSHNPNVGPQSKGYQPDIAYTLEARSQTQAVAFTQNTRDEVRLINGDGQIAGALAAQPGMKQTTYISEIARSLTARHDGSPCDDRGPNIVAVPTWPADIAPTLDAGHANTQGIDDQHVNSGAGLFVPTAFQSSQSGVRTGELHATLDSNNGSRRHNGVISQSAVRRLTPRECERLQGFPDDWTAITIKGKPAADAPRYKALGNSMAVPVMRYILDRVKLVDERK